MKVTSEPYDINGSQWFYAERLRDNKVFIVPTQENVDDRIAKEAAVRKDQQAAFARLAKLQHTGE